MKFSLQFFIDLFYYFWDFRVYSSGNTFITLGEIIIFFTAFALLYLFAFKLIRKVLLNSFLRLHADKSTATRAASAASYIFFFLGITITLESFGIDMTALSLIGGAIGIGIGLGLQNITNNFISGIIMFFEKPIKIGDRVELDNIQGNIKHVSFRATTIITNDDISVIVPNSFFIQNKVINWSHTTHKVRVHIPVDVSYKSDPEHVKKVLLEIAQEADGVMTEIKPLVIFKSFGESALNFDLLVWTDKYIDTPALLKSNLYFTIFERFKQENIELPFPQRDIHLIDKTVSLPNS